MGHRSSVWGWGLFPQRQSVGDRVLQVGLGERVLGLGVFVGDGLRPLVRPCGVEYDGLLCRRVSLCSLSPGLVLCLYWYCGC